MSPLSTKQLGMSWGRQLFKCAIRKRIHLKFGGVCHLCDKPVSLTQMTVDHLQPIKLGGPHEEDNLAPAHGKCNQERGFMSVAQYKHKLALKVKPLGVTRNPQEIPR